jgi:hypothetical protein
MGHHKVRLLSALIGFVLAAPPTALAAQATAPEAVAAALLAADASADWRTVLHLSLPGAVITFKQREVEQLRLAPGGDARQDSVLEQAIDSMWGRQLLGFINARRTWLLDSVYRVPTIDSLSALPADSVLARWYQSRLTHPRPTHTRYLIRGVAQPSDTVAYVVLELTLTGTTYATDDAAPERPHFSVLMLSKVEGEWRTTLDVVPTGNAGMNVGVFQER